MASSVVLNSRRSGGRRPRRSAGASGGGAGGVGQRASPSVRPPRQRRERRRRRRSSSRSRLGFPRRRWRREAAMPPSRASTPPDGPASQAPGEPAGQALGRPAGHPEPGNSPARPTTSAEPEAGQCLQVQLGHQVIQWLVTEGRERPRNDSTESRRASCAPSEGPATGRESTAHDGHASPGRPAPFRRDRARPHAAGRPPRALNPARHDSPDSNLDRRPCRGRRLAVRAQSAAPTAAPSSSAPSDTVAIEHFARTATTLEGTLAMWDPRARPSLPRPSSPRRLGCAHPSDGAAEAGQRGRPKAGCCSGPGHLQGGTRGGGRRHQPRPADPHLRHRARGGSLPQPLHSPCWSRPSAARGGRSSEAGVPLFNLAAARPWTASSRARADSLSLAIGAVESSEGDRTGRVLGGRIPRRR